MEGRSVTRRRLAAGAVVVAVAAGGLAACTEGPPAETAPVIIPGRPGESASTAPPGQASAPPVPPPNAADEDFVRNMIIHHHQAVDLAALAPQRAASDPVKRLADRIASAQRPEIDMMNDWLRTHGKPTVEHGGHDEHPATMPGMASQAQIDALRAAGGPDFDRLFLQLMITHHQGALTMASQVQAAGVDGRVQEIADDVIATQSAEISRMKTIQGS